MDFRIGWRERGPIRLVSTLIRLTVWFSKKKRKKKKEKKKSVKYVPTSACGRDITH